MCSISGKIIFLAWLPTRRRTCSTLGCPEMAGNICWERRAQCTSQPPSLPNTSLTLTERTRRAAPTPSWRLISVPWLCSPINCLSEFRIKCYCIYQILISNRKSGIWTHTDKNSICTLPSSMCGSRLARYFSVNFKTERNISSSVRSSLSLFAYLYVFMQYSS